MKSSVAHPSHVVNDPGYCSDKRSVVRSERFSEDVLASSARRTTRLDCIVHHLGLALGGRPPLRNARPCPCASSDQSQ
jgi:hypothetical protein